MFACECLCAAAVGCDCVSVCVKLLYFSRWRKDRQGGSGFLGRQFTHLPILLTFVLSHVCAFPRLRICMFAQLHVYAFARLRICTCTHLHVYAFARVRICICTHLHVYAITHLCICTFAHLHVCKFARLRICTYTHLHVYAFALLRICTFLHLQVCVFARVRICRHKPCKHHYTLSSCLPFHSSFTGKAYRIQFLTCKWYSNKKRS